MKRREEKGLRIFSTRLSRRTGYTIGTPLRDTPCQAENCPKTLNVGMAQLTQGLAWHFKRYAHEQSEEDRERYAFAEDEARAKGVDLWNDPDPIPPWEWRRRMRR